MKKACIEMTSGGCKVNFGGRGGGGGGGGGGGVGGVDIVKCDNECSA